MYSCCRDDFLSSQFALQQHETKRDSPLHPTIGTVVAELTRAFDNRVVTRRAGSRQ
jgi:hypothetical protein